MSLFNRKARGVRGPSRKRNPVSLDCEQFEDRLLLSTLLVTNTADTGSGSLRQAILDANLASGKDTIDFNIPDNQTGLYVINLNTTSGALPPISDVLTLDGTSESVSLGKPAVVEVNGNGLTADGLTLALNSGGSTILGMTFADFNGNGLSIQSNANTIGGTTTGQGNVIISNSVAVQIGAATHNVLLGNYIGTNAAGQNLGNAVGIQIGGANNTVGGPGAGNTIGFNTQQGVLILSGNQNVVSQNLYEGTNGSGTPVQANDIVLLPGANNSQPAPTLLTTYLSGGNLVAEVSGVSVGTVVELYQLTTALPGQRIFLGSGSVTSLSGILTVTIPAGSISNGAQIVATGTVAANGTSAFSAAQTVADLYTVINTNPSGAGSLNQAIVNADDHTGLNTITFAITGGSKVIQPTAVFPLPPITDQVIIDGTTQAGVVIDGGALAQDGFLLRAGSDGSAIKGLTVQNFGKAGIHLQSSNDVITDLVVGTSGLGNQAGIFIDGASHATIGGTTGAAANTIGFNAQQGIEIVGGGNNTVEGNFIGTNSASANQGNGIGVLINNSSGNIVGGTGGGAANTLGFSSQQGIAILSGNQDAVRQNQYVGTNGPAIPVPVNDIALLPGANHSQPAPALASASIGGGNLTVQLSVGVPSGTSVDVELYQVVSSGTGQRTFLGSGTITTSAGLSSVVIPAGTLTNGSVIVATATVAANGTSPFSTSLTVANLFTVINTNASGPGSLAQAIINANVASGTDVITFAIPSGPLVISPTSALPLPTVTDGVTIDGTTEPGIIIDGSGLSQDGFVLGAGSDGSTIKGLTIQNFGKAGIHIQSTNDTIAGLMVGTPGHGNQAGILIDGGSNVTIGGTTGAAANTIGFNAQQGIQILGGGTTPSRATSSAPTPPAPARATASAS